MRSSHFSFPHVSSLHSRVMHMQRFCENGNEILKYSSSLIFAEISNVQGEPAIAEKKARLKIAVILILHASLSFTRHMETLITRRPLIQRQWPSARALTALNEDIDRKLAIRERILPLSHLTLYLDLCQRCWRATNVDIEHSNYRFLSMLKFLYYQ